MEEKFSGPLPRRKAELLPRRARKDHPRAEPAAPGGFLRALGELRRRRRKRRSPAAGRVPRVSGNRPGRGDPRLAHHWIELARAAKPRRYRQRQFRLQLHAEPDQRICRHSPGGVWLGTKRPTGFGGGSVAAVRGIGSARGARRSQAAPALASATDEPCKISSFRESRL